MLNFLKFSIFTLPVLLCSVSFAGDKERVETHLEAGAFSGRIARTQNGNTTPFNSSNGSYVGAEVTMGSNWRGVVAGSLTTFTGTVATAYETAVSSLQYSEAHVGGAYQTENTSWRLLYMYHETPYTDAPEVNTLVPAKKGVNYLRLESVLRGKGARHRVEIQYYFNQQLNPTAVEGGYLTSKYYLGGCARAYLGDSFRFGSSVCLDLQEAELPNSAVISRQEFHAHIMIGF